MKKLVLGLFVMLLGMGLFACGETGEETMVFENDDQVFTLEALSAANLLNYSEVEMLSYVPLAETTEVITDEIMDEEVDELDQYMEMMDLFLGENNALSISVLTSDREDYDYKISFTTVDTLANEIVYFLYYNETTFEIEPSTTEPITTTETVTEDQQTTQPLSAQLHQYNFQDNDDDLVVYLIEGLIVQGDLEYNVEGKRVVKEDGAEVFRLRSFIDTENYVRVDYQMDATDGNKKFFYKIVEDGVTISESRIHVVSNNGALNVHLDFEDASSKAKYQFTIIEEEEVTLIHIKYDITSEDGVRETGNIHVEATVDPDTGTLVYTYKVLEGNAGSNGNQYKKTIQKRHENTYRNNNNNQNNNGDKSQNNNVDKETQKGKM